MRRSVLIAAAVFVVVIVAAQITLPAIAEHRLRSQLAAFGEVESVKIGAFPAITLLWKRADDVDVRMRSYRSGNDSLADFLASTERTDRLDVRVDDMQAGALELRDVRMRKDGDRLTGAAGVTRAALSAALPPGLNVEPVGADPGGIVFRGSASLFGVGASLRLRATVLNGAVRIQPDGIPFAGLASITVFADGRIDVEALGGLPRADGYTLTARARLAK